MQSTIFRFKAATTQESMNNAVRVLSGIDGVGTVTPSIVRNEVNVQFDATRASPQRLQAALDEAGYGVVTGNTGGCGGGGGGCSCS
ncbi:MAG TPA: heavy-metal-associated domain-containing protein [Noviherbaspirillum sp.]|uniref:heavy-metal-associated domain-containing protein n=1 Tax=Noviherbaspirillum sp. TaxID=1926288 RepID=UPI002D28EA98|nr:heavy-metal-associated domain-containing protein [Noviherbaspirillum sp.]HYD95011.1 heavy-metal-associated domain-containing protein [Noviherbaspirillum sp.]